MGECMNELAGNRVLLPFCHWPAHSNDPVYSHLVEVTCRVLAVSGLCYMLGGYVFGVNQGTEVFNLLQNIGSSPNDLFL